METVWAVIPGYNEGKHIGKVVKGARKYAARVVAVDDGSTDDTYAASEKAGAVALRHMVNMGKGAALKTGCDYAVREGARLIVVLDADGQHEPDEIPKFLEELRKGNDIVFGYRALDRNMPAVLKFGNWFINSVTRILYGMNLKDTQSGYRAFTAKAYRKIRWEATDYSMESEMIANVGRAGLKYSEIEIRTIYSDRYKGTTVVDGFKIVGRMIWWKISRW